MSQDIRRRLAYFGPREKVYPRLDQTEVHGLPVNWRRILSMSYRSPVVGPFGCVYADIEHALCAYRYLYTSNRPVYATLFRSEVARFAGSPMCRRWGSANGMSLLLTDPNDRIWYLVRDQCMFELVFQRYMRDPEYHFILTKLVDAQLLPVYHVRTANDSTYWGATINRDLVSNTLYDRSPKETPDQMYQEAEKSVNMRPSDLLIGRNRLGEIMLEVVMSYRQFYDHKVDIGSISIDEEIRQPFTPLGPFGFDTIEPPVAPPPSPVTVQQEEEGEEDEQMTCACKINTPREAEIDSIFEAQDTRPVDPSANMDPKILSDIERMIEEQLMPQEDYVRDQRELIDEETYALYTMWGLENGMGPSLYL